MLRPDYTPRANAGPTQPSCFLTENRGRRAFAADGQETVDGDDERVAEVRRWLSNDQELREAVEGNYELNHELLRPARAAAKVAACSRCGTRSAALALG